jgi:exopolyphosphatase / guanosine-5'-triphosphate,3'-diphosphate pyrophosphatase
MMRSVSGSPQTEPAIVPRWEWRTFGSHFGPAEDRFAALTPGAILESDEVYFLSGAEGTSGIVKVRNDLMDVKVLREVNPDGLEQWTPVMKAAFPLSASDVTKVFAPLRQDPPSLARDAYTLSQFVDELATLARIRTVPVHKRRARYTVGGCSAELTDVAANGRSTRTIAIESEDPAAVIAAVRDVGLGDYVNTSYPRGLAALLGDAAERYAMIDVGTNSVKFLVGERTRDGSWRAVVDRAELTRLGEGLDETGKIAPEALERTAHAVAGMVDEARRTGAIAIAMVGTSGLRVALNSEDVIAAIRERTGVTLEVISGEEEGRLAYLAVLAGLRLTEGSSIVFDTGGGSTQFTFGHGGHVDEQFSVQVGAVRYTERFGLDGVVPSEVLNEALAAIAADFTRIDGRPPPDALVGMGGALTNIAAVKHALATYDPDVVQGTVLDRTEIDHQIELYRSRDAAARREIVGLQPKRADVILAGACIVRTIMGKLNQESLRVSDRGLRHGLLIARFGANRLQGPSPTR